MRSRSAPTNPHCREEARLTNIPAQRSQPSVVTRSHLRSGTDAVRVLPWNPGCNASGSRLYWLATRRIRGEPIKQKGEESVRCSRLSGARRGEARRSTESLVVAREVAAG